jgi:hypothetical protein
MSRSLTSTETPLATQRAVLPPAGGPHYVIEGRPGWRYASVEEACLVAADLVKRLRLNQRVMVRETGSEATVAMVGRDGDGVVQVIRLVGGAA